ncbi:MAG: LL-diaminopimelate aminotransferase [Candidatus Dadabacteria bacterium]|nr:LL-diaminopimelate aminotransferase [Candidatus Dadabacteria bacterium]MYC40840.1 LL-diaminopimelate aminotransferase [Candidatus Dadabacteria bacterium]
MEIKWAKRIEELPPYLFAEIDRKKDELVQKGVDVIDLGVGDPDIPTPDHIIESLREAAGNPEHHRYPSYVGMLSFREAAADWYAERFGVTLDPAKEVVTLIGSKEGIAHAPLAFVDPGDVALVPDPGYPVYPVSTTFAGGVPYPMPLLKENGFFPDLDAIPSAVAEKAVMMFLNYPNNPTTVLANEGFFKEVVDFARENSILVCHDAAYTEIAFYGQNPISFLEIPGAMDVGIEFHSLSKTFSMTGWRLAFAAGNEKAIAGLGKIKTNIDSGAFQAVQEAGITALQNSSLGLEERKEVYRERLEIFCRGLEEAGIEYTRPEATFYVWFEVPEGISSSEFCARMLSEAGVVVTPGNGFGDCGEGYARVSVTFDTERIRQAAERIASFRP